MDTGRFGDDLTVTKRRDCREGEPVESTNFIAIIPPGICNIRRTRLTIAQNRQRLSLRRSRVTLSTATSPFMYVENPKAHNMDRR